MAHTGEFELLVLLAVRRLGDGAYGVTILEELERETSRTFSLGSVYKTLGRLESKGCVRARVAPPTRQRGGRRKKLYALTPAGGRAVHQALADLQRLAQGFGPKVQIT